jgi:branched-subunit amino acid transport protein AzlD
MIAELSQLFSRVGAFLRSDELDRDFNEELESHLAMLVEDYMARGMPAEEARQRAQLALGGTAQLIDAHRAVRGLPFLDAIHRDARHGVRFLGKHPVVVLTAIVLFCLKHQERQHKRAAVALLAAGVFIRYVVQAQHANGHERIGSA